MSGFDAGVFVEVDCVALILDMLVSRTDEESCMLIFCECRSVLGTVEQIEKKLLDGERPLVISSGVLGEER